VCGRECLTDEECDDGIECTWDICDDFWHGCLNRDSCQFQDLFDNDCTEGLCNRDTGECSYSALPDGTACGECTARGTCWIPFCGILFPCGGCCTAWAGVCEAGVCLD
jgi:hypothetical protein